MTLIKNKILFILFLAIIVSNAFWSIGVMLDFNHFPFSKIKEKAKEVKLYFDKIYTDIAFNYSGEAAYIQEKIANQEAKSTIIPKSGILTSVDLKMNRQYKSLLDEKFALKGGGLGVMKGKLLILDRLGRLFVYDGKIIEEIIIDLPINLNQYLLENNRENIFMDETLRAYSIAFDEVNSRLFVSYNKYEGERSHRLVVSAIELDVERLKVKGEWQTLFQTHPIIGFFNNTRNGGGKLLIAEDHLYIAVGYTVGDKPEGIPLLDSTAHYGKIFKVNILTKDFEVFSNGHRNIQGMTFCEEEKIFATEHGPQGGDEINLIEHGKNYGWPFYTYGTTYGKYEYSYESEITLDKYQEPIFSFVPSIGISALIQIKSFSPEWKNDYLLGSLKAQSLYRIRIDNNHVMFSEPIWVGHRVRDLIEIGNKIIILTDDAHLIELSPSDNVIL